MAVRGKAKLHIFCVDKSASMWWGQEGLGLVGKSRLNIAREHFNAKWRELEGDTTENHKVVFFTFNSDISPVILAPATLDDAKSRVMNAWANLKPEGDTNLLGCADMALDYATNVCRQNHQTFWGVTILIFTDGMDDFKREGDETTRLKARFDQAFTTTDNLRLEHVHTVSVGSKLETARMKSLTDTLGLAPPLHATASNVVEVSEKLAPTEAAKSEFQQAFVAFDRKRKGKTISAVPMVGKPVEVSTEDLKLLKRLSESKPEAEETPS